MGRIPVPVKDPVRRRELARARGRRYRRRLKAAAGLDPSVDYRGKGRHVSASRHPRWNAQRLVSRHGYVKVRVGRRHPLADPNGYAYEHLIILAAAGLRLSAGQVAHHLNGDKTDNRIENLEVTTRSAHNSHHNAHRPRDRYGRLTARQLLPPQRDLLTGRYMTGPRPATGGRLLDGREWRQMPP